jgi:hypothetical protein
MIPPGGLQPLDALPYARDPIGIVAGLDEAPPRLQRKIARAVWHPRLCRTIGELGKKQRGVLELAGCLQQIRLPH